MMKSLGLFLISFTALLGTALNSHQVAVSRKHNVLEETGTAARLKLNTRVEPFSFKDLKGHSYSLQALLKKGPVAFVFLSVHCPVAQRYTVRLNQLHKEFSKRGVTLLGVNSNYNEAVTEVNRHAREMNYLFPVIKDEEGQIARRLGASMTPQAFVIDKQGFLRYQGAIDDNRYENRVRHFYLRDALVALLKRKPVKVASTPAFGCTIHLPPATNLPTERVTYAKQIAPILQQACQPCHRPGQVAPFSLLTYEEAKAWAQEIKHYTQARLMPPWKPEPGYGEFRDERRLTDEQVALIARWVDSGMPFGDPNDLPPPRTFPEGWQLGEPDLVVEMPQDYEIAPTGEDEYRHFVIPTNLDSDRYVQAIDIQPGNRKTVHHVIAYVDTTGAARKLDERDPGLGYTASGGWPGFVPSGMLGGWAPGFTPSVLPEGTGVRLPKGADIVLQLHYYRTGKPERDRSKIGLYFAKTENPKPVFIRMAINTWFAIPPGAERHEVRARWQAKEDVYLVAITPHMHLLGKEMQVTATLPSGEKKPLIWIKQWDFNWQNTYHYKEPLLLPKGTQVEVVAYYDNSERNPRNPNRPPQLVRWGEKTTDEMCLVFLFVVKAEDYRAILAGK